MKTAVVYYSWSGKTRRLATARAEKEGAQLFEIKDEKKPGKLKAIIYGCYTAITMKRTPTLPFTAPLAEYDRIIIMAPVWAGHPAPAINTVFDALPSGKEVALCLVSSSGVSDCRERVETLINSKGCKLVEFENVKG